MKKIYTSALAALLLSTSFATADVAAPTGFYVGIQQGYNMMQSKYKNVSFDAFDTASASVKKRTSGILGEVLVGWRKNFSPSNWTAGLELAFGSDTNVAKKKIVLPHVALGPLLSEDRVKREYFFTPAITVGKNLCANWHGFVKLGMPISRFTVRSSNNSSAAFLGGRGEHFKKTATKIGFAPAIGAEYALTKRFSVQGSIGMEWHKKISKKFIPFDKTQPTSSYQPKINQLNGNVKIGLICKI